MSQTLFIHDVVSVELVKEASKLHNHLPYDDVFVTKLHITTNKDDKFELVLFGDEKDVKLRTPDYMVTGSPSGDS